MVWMQAGLRPGARSSRLTPARGTGDHQHEVAKQNLVTQERGFPQQLAVLTAIFCSLERSRFSLGDKRKKTP